MTESARTAEPARTTETVIPVVERILSANDRVAGANRQRLDASRVLTLNVMASPGAGKTSVILHTLRALAGRARMAVVEGDTAPVTIDSEKVAALGVPVVQVNTGGACHLDAEMMSNAFDQLPLDRVDLVIVENVGNLICPAGFKLGTHVNVLIASLPEGDDKPWKYPKMYRGVDVLLVNKTDLAPYVDFDMTNFRRGVEALNPGVVTFPVSCRTGDGLGAWTDWLAAKLPR
ncbi:MAG: hydrogenase nickel incorporation protein HypB [Planctomycetes bacterium]|nr:hydrogenase nickel incorporation protein HypB [Planctomycetota bacterium]